MNSGRDTEVYVDELVDLDVDTGPGRWAKYLSDLPSVEYTIDLETDRQFRKNMSDLVINRAIDDVWDSIKVRR